MLKDSKSRLIIKGAHRDMRPMKSDKSDVFMPDVKFTYTPMTNFSWNI